jgi:type I restriction enzyme S subunit
MTGAAGLKRVSPLFIENYTFALPPLPEQQAIATFLDKQCAEADSIIADMEEQVSLLRQYKKAVITETITKGEINHKVHEGNTDTLCPSSPLWLKLKYICSLRAGDSLTNTELSDEDTLYPVYGGGKQMGYYKLYNVPANTILIGRVGANCGCITKVSKPSWATDNALIVNTNVNPNYLCYLLESSNLNDMNETSAQPLVTASKVLEHKVSFVESSEEQQRMAACLDTKCRSIDNLIKDKQDSIGAMKEYRKSLIYEYTTGKKRVEGRILTHQHG